MKRFLMIGAGLIGVVGAAALGAYVWAGSAADARLAQTWPDVVGKDFPIPFPLTDEEIESIRAERVADLPEDVDPETIVIEPEEAARIALERAVARGEHMARTQLGCIECHGSDGAGGLVADAQPVFTWYAPNITPGSRVKDYTAADWDRLLRHGVLPDDRNATMPSVDFQRLADRDVADIAAWAASLPASDIVQPETEYGPVGRFLMATGEMVLSAEVIDHDQDTPALPPEAVVDEAYGAYVAATCVGCHREDYRGGPIIGGDPAWPPAANLTPHESGLAGWTKDQWMNFWQTGTRPDGTVVDEAMPWAMLGQMGQVELEAMYLYLMSLEALPTGE